MPEMTPQAAIQFLVRASEYFRTRPVKDELGRRENKYNSDGCLKIADLLRSIEKDS